MAVNSSPDKPQVFRSPTAVVVWIVWLLFAVGNWIDLAARGRDHASAVAAAILLLATGVACVTAQRPRIVADKTGVTIRNPLRDHRIGWAGVAKVDLADLLRVHCALDPPGGSGGEGSPPGSRGSRGVVLRGQTQRKVISAWAVPYSRRRQLAADVRVRRAARFQGLRRSSLGLAASGRSYGAPVSAPETSAAEAEAKKVVRILSERATVARAEAIWAGGTAEATGAPAASGTGTASPAGGTTALDAADGADGSEPLKSTWSGRAIAALVIPALILLVVWLV